MIYVSSISFGLTTLTVIRSLRTLYRPNQFASSLRPYILGVCLDWLRSVRHSTPDIGRNAGKRRALHERLRDLAEVWKRWEFAAPSSFAVPPQEHSVVRSTARQ